MKCFVKQACFDYYLSLHRDEWYPMTFGVARLLLLEEHMPMLPQIVEQLIFVKSCIAGFSFGDGIPVCN